VFIIVVVAYFIIDSVQKLLDTPLYSILGLEDSMKETYMGTNYAPYKLNTKRGKTRP